MPRSGQCAGARMLLACLCLQTTLFKGIMTFDSKLFNDLFYKNEAGQGYNPAISPGDAYNEQPTQIEVSMLVTAFDSVDSVDMEYMLSAYLQQHWVDRRLSYNASQFDGVKKLIIPYSKVHAVWLPDTMLVNAKIGQIHTLTKPNEGLVLYPNGSITYSLRITSTFSCHMNLERFPMDNQRCPLMIESYMYDQSRIDLSWKTGGWAVILRPGLKTAKFEHSAPAVSKSHTDTITGRYASLRADFHLTRRIGHYVAQIYVPSILVVILSWVSFFVAVEATPARVSLGILTVLTMITLFAGSRSVSAGTSSMKSLDIWIAVCMLFVFAALCEYALANAMYRRHIREEKRKEQAEKAEALAALRMQASMRSDCSGTSNNKNNNRCSSGEEKLVDDTANLQQQTSMDSDITLPSKKRTFKRTNLKLARRIDSLSAVLFPTAFVFFNIVYWTAYLLPPHQHYY